MTQSGEASGHVPSGVFGKPLGGTWSGKQEPQYGKDKEREFAHWRTRRGAAPSGNSQSSERTWGDHLGGAEETPKSI